MGNYEPYPKNKNTPKVENPSNKFINEDLYKDKNINLKPTINNNISKSICKIFYENSNKEKKYVMGFFMNIYIDTPMKFLITNYKNISLSLKNKIIDIEIMNKKIQLKLEKNRYIKLFKDQKDILIIEIKDSDGIIEEIEFLDFDLYFEKEYSNYRNLDIFSLEFSNERDIKIISGKITKINGSEFEHNIPIKEELSGNPIMLLSNSKFLNVIGIHKLKDEIKNLKYGTFIVDIPDEIFNELTKGNYIKKEINANNKANSVKNNNYIIAEINIDNSNINKNIRIINSYENLEENCEIKVNNHNIRFNTFYKFNNRGKNRIQYSFDNYLTKINHLFSGCNFLTNIDLSNFNSQNIIYMKYMLSGCNSLRDIHFSNFNTQNVSNMDSVFSGCESLTQLNLSNFNTKKVIDMSNMFWGCISLKNINLSSFNTRNVINMSNMFWRCKSLLNINLSNFNTQNVTNMAYMFYGCESLTNINLSNFNTQNVTNMAYMFYGCKSIININLSNFNTQNVTNMAYMFYGCESLINIDLSNFNTQKLINISYMFSGCTSLKNMNISNFNTKNIIDKDCMFSGCISLKESDIKIK